MFAVRRIFRNRKALTKHICTSNVAKCEESKKSDTAPAEKTNEDVGLRKSEQTSQEKKNLFATGKKMKMTKPKSIEQPQKNQKQKETSSYEFKTDFFKKILKSSAEAVAEDLGGNKEKTKEDLLAYIKTFEVTKQKPRELMDHYVTPIPEAGDSSSVQNIKGLNIFKPETMQTGADDQVKLNIWDSLEAEYLEYQSQKSPRNYFEELIQWTNEGKLWHFPINNDQGMEEEAKISFTEHVFLEQHLEPWCPKRGPLRRFMDLVLIGLAKNPYLTVEDKKEHIKWFENYFESKKKLLQELGAFSTTKELGTSS